MERRGVALLAAALLGMAGLTACGDDDGGADGGASSAPASSEATVETQATTSAVGSLETAPGAPIAPGRYASDEFAVPFEISIPDGWTAGGGELEEYFDIFSASAATGSVGIATLENAVDPRDPEARRTVRPEDLLRFLHTHPRLDAEPITPTTLGGRPASAFDFTVDGDTVLKGAACPPGDGCVPIGTLSDGGKFGFLAGERGRILVVETTPPMVVLSSSARADAAAHRRAAEEVIGSIAFTE